MSSEATEAGNETSAPPEYRVVEIDRLRECKHNPRQHFDPDAMAELTASVKRNGVLTPLIVRAISNYPVTYEIAAGHRRYRAAKAAGVATAPVIVRDLTDEQFTEILNLENLQRADLNPLEEAEGYRQLLKLKGRDVASVALQVSRSTKYVYDRIKLLELDEPARDLLVAGEITVGHAILLARLAPMDQKEAIKSGLWQPERGMGLWGESRKAVSVRELTAWIDENVRFDREHVDPIIHPETHATLFGAQESELTLRVVPITVLHQVPANARADERTLCRTSWKRADGQPDPHDFSNAKKPSKECEHSAMGVIVVGPARGQTFRICDAKKKCRVHWPEKTARRGSNAGREAASREKAKADANAERWRREDELRNARRDEWKKVAKEADALFDEAIDGSEDVPGSPIWRFLSKALKLSKIEGRFPTDLLRAIAHALVEEELRRALWNGGSELDEPAKLLGVNLKPLRKRIEAAVKLRLADKDAAGVDSEGGKKGRKAASKAGAAAQGQSAKRSAKRGTRRKAAPRDASAVAESAAPKRESHARRTGRPQTRSQEASRPATNPDAKGDAPAAGDAELAERLGVAREEPSCAPPPARANSGAPTCQVAEP